MTEIIPPQPADFFANVAVQEQDVTLLGASDSLLDLTDQLVGSKSPDDAVQIAFNLLHPENAINREHWRSVDWVEQTSNDRKMIASEVMGTLLLNRAFTDQKEASTDRAVLGLPSFAGQSVIESPINIGSISELTGLRKDRVIHRRYEALDSLARIWKTELGTMSPKEFWEIKKDLVPKIFDSFGQVGYGLTEILYRSDTTHPFIYIDRIFNGRKPDNPLMKIYANGIAGYNKYANSGRDAVINHLDNTEFRGDQRLLDLEAVRNLESVEPMRQKLAEISRMFKMASKKPTGWLADSEELLNLEKTTGFTQTEAFKIAELKIALSQFNPEENGLQRYSYIAEQETTIQIIAEAYKVSGQTLPKGISVIVDLLEGSSIDEIAELSGTAMKPISVQMGNGITTLHNLMSKIPEGEDVTVENISKLISPKSPSAKTAGSDKTVKPAAKPKAKPNKRESSTRVNTFNLPDTVEGPIPNIDLSLLLGTDTPEYLDISSQVFGTTEGRKARTAALLNQHARDYESGNFENIPPSIKTALDAFFGNDN